MGSPTLGSKRKKIWEWEREIHKKIKIRLRGKRGGGLVISYVLKRRTMRAGGGVANGAVVDRYIPSVWKARCVS